jgi:hypothetical protein
MQKLKLLLSITIFSGIFLSGCSWFGANCEPVREIPYSERVDRYGTPLWVNNPQNHPAVKGTDKPFAVGSAVKHVRGKSEQRLKATTLAIDMIARQMGVKVDNTVEREDISTDRGGSSNMRSYSVQTVEGKVVDIKIIEMWTDPRSKEIHVLAIGE